MANGDNGGARPAKLQFVRAYPAAAATISKAVKAHISVTGFDASKRETYFGLNQSKIKAISDQQKERLSENQDIMDLFPDIGLAEQIVISSILSPKDMFTGNLIYQSIQTLFPTSVQNQINEVIRSHMDTYYNLGEDLPNILREALFRTGSYAMAVIPEAAVDEIINGQNYSMEAHAGLISELIDTKGRSKSIGILGPASSGVAPSKALESFFSNQAPPINIEAHVKLTGKICLEDKKEARPEEIFKPTASTEGFLEITDNYQLLKLPDLVNTVARQRIKTALRNPIYSRKVVPQLAHESYADGKTPDKKKLSHTEFRDLIYRTAPVKNDTFVIFPSRDSQRRYSVGRPLRMRIPSEAVVPVYPPGEPSKHRGYFVLVDMDGNWVTRNSMDTSHGGLQSLMNSQASAGAGAGLGGALLDKAAKTLSDSSNNIVIDNMLEIYGSIVENEMVSRLRNGIYGTELEVGKDKEWDRIMLARALSGKMTRLVYLPNEIVTYYAFDYHENGVGKSYLDQIRVLTSMLAMLTLGKLMAQLKNAINVTKVNMKLDADDPDPKKTIEMATRDILRLREQYFPLGITNASDLVQWLQRAGLMFTFEGHPGLPSTAFDFQTGDLVHRAPDDESANDLRKRIFMTFGLTPEQVDQGFSAEFATTIIQNNVLFAKRILLLSDITSKHLTADVRNTCTNDTVILQEIMSVLQNSEEDISAKFTDEDKKEYARDKDKFLVSMLDRIIENVKVDLPKPDIASKERKAEDFQKMSEMIDKVLDSFIGPEVFSQSINGEIASHAAELKNMWKHLLLRKWVTDEGFLPEINELFRRDEDGNPANEIVSVMSGYIKDFMVTSGRYIKAQQKARDAMNKDLANMNVGPGSDNSVGGGSFSFGGGMDGGTGGGSSSGIFDLDGNLDSGLEDPASDAGLDASLTGGGAPAGENGAETLGAPADDVAGEEVPSA